MITTPEPVECEICIVGGGMVGAALALALGAAGRSVVVWEKQRPVPMTGRLGMGIRTVALSPASESWLRGLGVMPEGASLERMHVFEALGTAVLDFAAAEAGAARLGRIVENDHLVDSLWAQLESRENVRVLFDASLERLEPDERFVRLYGADLSVSARLCIAADGGASAVRSLAGGSSRRLDTGQWALATIARTSKPHGGCACQRFLPDGPVALLPGSRPDLVSVVWSQRPEQARARAEMDDAAFCAELSRATARILGDILEVDRRMTFPLVQQIANDLNPVPRVVLAGDAARVLHPLAGMGVNLGFEDAALLTRLCGRGQDPGAPELLGVYARRRQWRSRTLVRLMSALQDVFGWQGPGPVWVRNLGVRFVNGQALVKHRILQEALGLGPIASASR
jgi:2-octaprenyl-3-methyl-6-methoxy-1,4-benzoquinol hydroxylase/2-octaprenylphenol hydroxylase